MHNTQWFAPRRSARSTQPYKLAGTGDFNHTDGADVLWNNPTTGQVGTWLLHAI